MGGVIGVWFFVGLGVPGLTVWWGCGGGWFVGVLCGVCVLVNQIAVGTGVGVRYDATYLLLRLDMGIGLHLPYATSRKGWYNIPKFGDGFGIHLAIGYPF